MAKKTHKTPEHAREAILDAAQKTVFDVGPAGLRISAVAKQAKMAHPNIIHHFGSRQGLLNALAKRVGDRATVRISTAISKATQAGPEERVLALTHVLDTAYPGNEGKVAVWLHMSGVEISLQENMQRIVELSHQLRTRVSGEVNIENTNRLVLLVTLALIGEVVSGVGIKDALGYRSKDGNRAHFHQWLAEILLNLSDSELSTSLSQAGLVDGGSTVTLV